MVDDSAADRVCRTRTRSRRAPCTGELRSLAAGKDQLELLEDPRLSKETAKLQQLVQHVRAKQPFFAARCARRSTRGGSSCWQLRAREKDANVFTRSCAW